MELQEPVVFGPAFEALERSFRLSSESLAQLRSLGVRFDAIQAAYPLSTFLAALDVVAASLDAVSTPTTRYRLLGRAYVKGWVGTKIGLASVTVGRLLGPKRMLLRMQQTFRTSANYVETTAVERPPRAIELAVRAQVAFLPKLPKDAGRLIDYRHGLLEGIIQQFGVSDSVDIIERDDARLMARYLVRW
jgi:uncharacterized protein (TIGR02265 family)